MNTTTEQDKSLQGRQAIANAFPMVVSESTSEAHEGLTKRQYYAALAMQGILAGGKRPVALYDEVAAEAWEYADALIAAELE